MTDVGSTVHDEAGQIINLRLGKLNLDTNDGSEMKNSRRSSGEARYQVDLQPEIVGFQTAENDNNYGMTSTLDQ